MGPGFTVIPKASKILDCSGLLGPLPVIKACQAINDVEVGQVLKIITTDAGAPLDMVAWSRLTGHELLDSRQEGGKFIFYCQRLK
ncbi:MAG: sulfurtransferase TusA family protein [Anaerolineae bacterium]